MRKINRTFLFSLFAILAVAAISCVKDTDNENRDKEKRLIDNYVKINNITETPTTSGLFIIPITEGTGATPGTAEFVLIKYKATTLDGQFTDGTDKALAEQNKVYPSFVLGGPLKFYLNGSWLPGLSEGLKTMREGGKTKMILSSSLSSNNDYIPRLYEVELLKVISDPDVYEKEQITNFLDTATNIGIQDSTASGIYYIEKLAGTGSVKPFTGNTVSIKYKGYLPDGRVFDKTENDTVFKFNVGGTTNKAIVGLDEGIRLMTTGGKATIVIPYYRGYGFNQFVPQYQIVIPFFSTLIFDVELIAIN